MLTRIYQWLCRHPSTALQSKDGRLWLVCLDCGYHSPGWTLKS